MRIGDAVRFVDEHGASHPALLTAVWGAEDDLSPSVNLVYVSDDAARHDPYGRQVDRRTSVVHRDRQAAHGMFWDLMRTE